MKKIIFILLITVFMAGTVLTSCQKSNKKDEAVEENVQEVEKDGMDAIEHDSAVQEQKAANADEWQDFKDKTNATIDANETRIAELKVKMKSTGKSIDEAYSKNIEALEQKNKDLKLRIEGYKNDASSDWKSFKEELSHDVDELDQALKDFTVNNKK